jgi:Trypsin-like peptidase domain
MESRTKPDRESVAASRRGEPRASGFGPRLAGLVLLCASGVVIAQAIAAPVADIAGRVKTGTGFFVSHDGFLVTSAHVVTGCGHVAVWAGGIERRNARLIAADLRRDVALLSTDGEAAEIAAASDRSSPRVGEATFGLGFGVIAKQPRTAMISRGTLVGDGATPAGDPVLVIRARVPEGASGGPVLDADGSLVGMMIGYYTEQPNLGVAVSSVNLDAFLAPRGLALARGPAAPAAAPSPRSLLLKISALVQCVAPQACRRTGGTHACVRRPQLQKGSLSGIGARPAKTGWQFTTVPGLNMSPDMSPGLMVVCDNVSAQRYEARARCKRAALSEGDRKLMSDPERAKTRLANLQLGLRSSTAVDYLEAAKQEYLGLRAAIAALNQQVKGEGRS